jgi:hypothetical protein
MKQVVVWLLRRILWVRLALEITEALPRKKDARNTTMGCTAVWMLSVAFVGFAICSANASCVPYAPFFLLCAAFVTYVVACAVFNRWLRRTYQIHLFQV